MYSFQKNLVFLLNVVKHTGNLVLNFQGLHVNRNFLEISNSKKT